MVTQLTEVRGPKYTCTDQLAKIKIPCYTWRGLVFELAPRRPNTIIWLSLRQQTKMRLATFGPGFTYEHINSGDLAVHKLPQCIHVECET